MRKNGESMEVRLDSISQVYARRRTPVSRTFSVPKYGSTFRKDAMIPVPMNNANISPTLWVKELNPFDPGLDLVRSRRLEGKECGW